MKLVHPNLGRLQRKVLAAVSVIVLVPMLGAGWFAAEWVSGSFEQRLEQWITDAARANQEWIENYQNDAIMIGRVLADDPAYLRRLRNEPEEAIFTPVRRIAQELGIHLLQLYSPDKRLLYSSIPIEMHALWDDGQTEAVLKVTRRDKSQLAAVGITPIPKRGEPRYYLVLGSLLGQDYAKELSKLTGMVARLYYREGNRYLDVFADDDSVRPLTGLSGAALHRIEKDKKSFYSHSAENGRYRGIYTPLIDSSGHVAAIMFSGLEKRGVQEVLTNQVAMFAAIAILGGLIGALTGLLLSRLVLRPLEYLRNGVMQVAGQNFSALVPIASDDELGDLAKAFNAMAARLREARDEQAQRYQKDKLISLGELSAALAHEIRNPIGVINTSAALLEKMADNPERRAQLTYMIRTESQRVSALVQDFLHLSRHRQPVFVPIDPSAPLERAVELALAGHPGIRTQSQFTHGAVQVQADAALLQQAWGNILTNSIQAMKGEGELTLSSRCEGADVVLCVEDSGPGVPAEIMPRLFEPFFTTKEHGTGLGLSIAYTLVDANGGRLEALPPAGKGARFIMRFRVIEESAK